MDARDTDPFAACGPLPDDPEGEAWAEREAAREWEEDPDGDGWPGTGLDAEIGEGG